MCAPMLNDFVVHRYEDIKILDDPLDGEYNSMSMMIQSPNSARSVGNLNMAWDESDIRLEYIYMSIYICNLCTITAIYIYITYVALYNSYVYTLSQKMFQFKTHVMYIYSGTMHSIRTPLNFKDTFINRTLSSVPNVYLTTSEMRTPHY